MIALSFIHCFKLGNPDTKMMLCSGASPHSLALRRTAHAVRAQQRFIPVFLETDTRPTSSASVTWLCTPNECIPKVLIKIDAKLPDANLLEQYEVIMKEMRANRSCEIIIHCIRSNFVHLIVVVGDPRYLCSLALAPLSND